MAQRRVISLALCFFFSFFRIHVPHLRLYSFTTISVLDRCLAEVLPDSNTNIYASPCFSLTIFPFALIGKCAINFIYFPVKRSLRLATGFLIPAALSWLPAGKE